MRWGENSLELLHNEFRSLTKVFEHMPFADDVTDGWGMQPGRRLMKFLTVVDVLSTARCHLVEVGPPGEVAETIEGLVREAC